MTLPLFSSPLPAPAPALQAQQSASLTPGEGAESPWAQSGQPGQELKAAAEECGRPRSPSLQKSPAGNKKADGAVQAPAEEEEEVVKDRTQQNRAQPPQPSTGPASRAANGSSASIPFIDCSDVDSECGLPREPVSQATNDNYEGDLTSGVYLLSGDERQIEARCRASPPSAKYSRPPSREFLDDDSADITFDLSGSPRLPRHSSLLSEMFKGSGGPSPVATPLSPSSRSSSPNMSWDRTGSQGYVSENGHEHRERSVGENILPSCGPCYENSSPISQRPYLRNLPSRYNKSETDPLILSQVASTSEAMDGLDGLEKGGLASLGAQEGGALANGAPLVGPTSAILVMRSVCASSMAEQLAPLQMTEGSTSSGTESSDSDSDVVPPLGQPLVFGNPAVLSSPCPPRNKKSLGGLHVAEEKDGDE